MVPTALVTASMLMQASVLSAAAADYVPEPQPVSTSVEICAYYFPGWEARVDGRPTIPPRGPTPAARTDTDRAAAPMPERHTTPTPVDMPGA